MRTIIILLGATLALLHPAQPQAADDVPSDGRTCFCLQHRASRATVAGCHGLRGRSDDFVTATCWDEQRQAEQTPIMVDDAWAMIRDGADRCTPCDRRPPRPTLLVPRE